MKATRMKLFAAVLAVFMMASCAPATENSAPPEDGSIIATAEAAGATPDPKPESALTPVHDYKRDRTDEYVYVKYGVFHEIDCEYLYGDLTGVLLVDAIEQGIEPANCCRKLGETKACEFPLNGGFERTMQVKRKIQMVSEAGKTVQDIVLVTTGDDVFDINNNFINNPCRFFYKEFGIDPETIDVYVRNNGREYHNTQCERAGSVADRYVIILTDAYDQGLTNCRTCLSPTLDYSTMPVKADDDAHFYYVTPAFIRRALRGDREIDPAMNIDMEKIENGYYDQ